MPWHPDDVAGIIVLFLVFGIPIIAILTSHQRKMALIYRDMHMQGQYPAENQQLAQQVSELRSLVVQQSLALDSLAESQRKLTMALEQRNAVDRINA